MCDTWHDKKIRSADAIFPSLSVMWIPFLAVSFWTMHMQYVHTTHMWKMQKLSWWRGANHNRQKNNNTNRGIKASCWGQMCLCLEVKGPLFTQIWKCLYWFKIIIWRYLQSWREMSTMTLILYKNKKIIQYSVFVLLLFKSSYLTITRCLHRNNNNNEIILMPSEPSPTYSSTLHLRTTKAKLPIWSRPQAMFSQAGMNSCLLKGILTISENCQRT